MTQKLVVIGAGMAAGRLLDRLFEEDGDWDVTLFNAEPRGSYNRIMLSPVLAGEKQFDEIVTHDADWYARHGVDCRFGEKVSGIDTQAKQVMDSGGRAVGYDKLVIASGSKPFILPMPGHDLDGVIAYRDLEDTERMMALGSGRRAVVIGGGLLGLEAAAGMAAQGADVTVVHIAEHLMERQLDGAAGALLRDDLEARGIKVRLATGSTEILGNKGHVRALLLADGTELPCDLLVMAVGIRPNTDLAMAAGLNVERGIVVDDGMRTSDPNVLAIGECVQHRGALFGLVAPVFDQAEVAAEVLAGREAGFTSKDVATRLKVTGCDLFSAGDFAGGPGCEDIVLRDPAEGVYKRYVLSGNRLIGAVMYGDTVDGPWVHELIETGRDVSAMRSQLAFGPAYAEPLDQERGAA